MVCVCVNSTADTDHQTPLKLGREGESLCVHVCELTGTL